MTYHLRYATRLLDNDVGLLVFNTGIIIFLKPNYVISTTEIKFAKKKQRLKLYVV